MLGYEPPTGKVLLFRDPQRIPTARDLQRNEHLAREHAAQMDETIQYTRDLYATRMLRSNGIPLVVDRPILPTILLATSNTRQRRAGGMATAAKGSAHYRHLRQLSERAKEQQTAHA